MWTTDEFEAPPTGDKTRPRAGSDEHSITWAEKAPYKVRYVCVSTDSMSAPSDDEARKAVLRGFDLLPTSALDLAAARIATWHTSANVMTLEGKSTLLGHIDDLHDCSLVESIFELPFEGDVPMRMVLSGSGSFVKMGAGCPREIAC